MINDSEQSVKEITIQVPPIIQFNHFYFRFMGTRNTNFALKDISLTIPKGSISLIGGISGAGKTTLCNAISGKIPHLISGEMSGELKILGKDSWDHDFKRLSQKISYIFQNTEEQLITFTVFDEIAFALENFKLPEDEIIYRIKKIANQLQINQLLDRPIHALSGGEKQKVVLAANLITSPQILILDEPLAFLDQNGERLLLSTLKEIHSNQPDLTIIIVEHRFRPFIDIINNIILLNENGELDFSGSIQKYNLFIKNAQHIYLRDSEYSHIYQLHAKSPQAIGNSSNIIQNSSSILKFENVYFTYPNLEKWVLANCSFDIVEGEFIGIVGNNGSGKTSLLYLMAHILNPHKGKIYYKNQPENELDFNHFIQNIGFIFQNPETQLFERTVSNEILYALNNFSGINQHDKSNTNEEKNSAFKIYQTNPKLIIDKYLKLINEKRKTLTQLADHNPFSLSWGQKRRLNLASIFSYEPSILLVDEPFIGQDAQSVEKIFEILHDFHSEGKTIVLISHDRKLLNAHCSRVLDLTNESVMAEFTTDNKTIHNINNPLIKNIDPTPPNTLINNGTSLLFTKGKKNQPLIKKQNKTIKKKLSKSRSKKNLRMKLYFPNFTVSNSNLTIIHKLNPLLKIIFLIFLTLFLFSVKSLILSISMFLCILLAIFLMKIPMKTIWKRMKWIFLMTAIYIPLNTIFDAQYSSNSEVLFYFFSERLPIRRLALYYTLRSSIIILTSLTSAMIYTETTNSKDLVYSLIQFKIPYRYAFAFMIGLRYIPLIEQDSNTIEIAQTLRGQSINRKSSIKKVIKHIYQRISTLLISILRKTQTTANAIDARGFGFYPKRTNLYKVKWVKANWVLIGICIVWIFYFLLITISLITKPQLLPSLYDIWVSFFQK